MVSNSDLPRMWRSSIYANSDLINVRTSSGYRTTRGDYKGERIYLSPHVSDEDLGAAVLKALECSRFVTPSEDPELFDLKKVQERYDAWIRELMERYGYTSKRQALKNMSCCSIKKVGDQISIDPTHHEKLEGWEGLDPELTVQIDAKSSPAEVGAALKLALSRCT